MSSGYRSPFTVDEEVGMDGGANGLKKRISERFRDAQP